MPTIGERMKYHARAAAEDKEILPDWSLEKYLRKMRDIRVRNKKNRKDGKVEPVVEQPRHGFPDMQFHKPGPPAIRVLTKAPFAAEPKDPIVIRTYAQHQEAQSREKG